MTVNTRTMSANAAALRRAAEILMAGGLVAFPTDTVYGVGAHALQPQAVERLYAAKRRPRERAIPLLLARADELEDVTQHVPEIAWRLVERFWPGALSLVLFKAPAILDVVTAGGPSVAVRLPAHPLTRELIAALGAPLATTSANLSGQPSPVTAQEVADQLAGRIELIVDGGLCPGGQPSTVLDLTTDPPRILRPGPVSTEALRALIPLAAP